MACFTAIGKGMGINKIGEKGEETQEQLGHHNQQTPSQRNWYEKLINAKCLKVTPLTGPFYTEEFFLFPTIANRRSAPPYQQCWEF